MEEIEIKWQDYKMNVDLYRSYLDFVVKLTMFYYAVTGAILSFHFSNTSIATSKYALIFPVLLSFALSIFLFYGARLSSNMARHIKKTGLELGIEVSPAGAVLVWLCVIFGFIVGVTFIALIWYLVCG